MSNERKRSVRLTSIAVLFCLVCSYFLVNLFAFQLIGVDDSDDGTTKRTVRLQAVRGSIYDRNGKLLVGNRNTYDLTLSYAEFKAKTNLQKNRTLIALSDALTACGEENLHEENYFPFDGQYPYYLSTEESLDGTSNRCYRYRRVLSDLGLKEGTTPAELSDYYVETYELLVQDTAGCRIFDDEQIDRLIRLYYDMDALRFASAGEYTFGENVSLSLLTYVRELSLSGVSASIQPERVYRYPGYASHILGTVGPIYSEEWDYYNELGYEMNAIVGKSGCEAAFEEYLHGTDGLMEITEDENGNVVSVEVKKEAVAGSDIRLTIDIDLQIAAEDGLAENVAYVTEHASGESTGSGCDSGAAVVMDPDTFEVLAIASYPTYDLATYNEDYSLLAADEAKPLLNRALNGTYAPGSTFKLGVAALALHEGAIDATDTVTCTGKYRGTVGCSTYGTNHAGAINVIRAIACSCNSFFCEMGDRLGIDLLSGYLSKFGFGQSTGIELREATGIIAGPEYRSALQADRGGDVETWQRGDTWNASIGQSDTQATPLQIAVYGSTLANGGTRYSAHLLKGVYAFGSEAASYEYEQTDGSVLSRADVTEAELATVYEGMREVVTGNNVIQRWINGKSVPVEVGAKTGTAQTGKAADNAVFLCTAPYANPKIVISVVLEQGVSGSNAALTAARILEAYYD